jgi:hypothetical protein
VKTSTIILIGAGALAFWYFARKPAAPAAPKPLPGQTSSANPWQALGSQLIATLGSYGSNLVGGSSAGGSTSTGDIPYTSTVELGPPAY